VVVLLFLLTAPVGAEANFINGGFETGDFTDWTVGGVTGSRGVATDGTPIPAVDPPFPPAFTNVRSGNFAAFTAVSEANGEFLSLSQTADLTAAGTYTVGFFMGNDSASEFGIGIDDVGAIPHQRLAIFVDGVHVPFTTRFPDNNFPRGSTPNDLHEFSSLFIHAGGPTTLELRISGSGIARAGISIDDAFLAVVPEPTTLLLFGTTAAGLGVARWRQRRRAKRAVTRT
jgi:PEP-CTERM motif